MTRTQLLISVAGAREIDFPIYAGRFRLVGGRS